MARRRSRKGRHARGRFSTVHSDAAGIDVGARSHVVAVAPDRDTEPVRTFQSFTQELHRLADWLKTVGISTVAMESTGVYWIPLFEILEERGFEVLLVNARDVKQVPGRKTDVNDAQWLQQLHQFGLLRASFRPQQDVVTLRSYLRQRERLIEYAAAHIQHMQKALVEMNVQLHHVVSDITGETGMRIVRAIVAGDHDPAQLAQHRDPRCRASVETIRDALVGNYREEHVFALRQALELYDRYQQAVDQCDRAIEGALARLCATTTPPAAPLPAPRHKTRAPNALAFDVRGVLYTLVGVDLTQIHGLGSYTALKLVSECGTDMSQGPTSKHFTSWLTLAPGNKISGGRVLSSKTRRSANRAAALLRLAATGLSRTDTALGAFYRRLSARVGKAKAVTATARKIAVLFYNTMRYGMQYADPGALHYEQRYRQRAVVNLRRRARALGFTLQEHPTGVS